MQIHDEVEEVRHLGNNFFRLLQFKRNKFHTSYHQIVETTFSDCYPSSKINFIQIIIKLHKFILKYILSKRLLTINLKFLGYIIYFSRYRRYLHTIPVECHQLHALAIITRIVRTNNFQLQNFAIFLPPNMRGLLKVFGGKDAIVFVSRI